MSEWIKKMNGKTIDFPVRLAKLKKGWQLLFDDEDCIGEKIKKGSMFLIFSRTPNSLSHTPAVSLEMKDGAQYLSFNRIVNRLDSGKKEIVEYSIPYEKLDKTKCRVFI